MGKIGVLLVNLGTPDAPTPEKVHVYLKEFLMDRFVIDIPGPLRWFFVNKIILRKRPTQSAALYKKVWRPEGSPLLMHSLNLEKALQNFLGENFKVVLGMRYGNPSIEAALRKIQNENVDEVRVIPLYPQYSLAATESSIDKVREIAAKLGFSDKIKFQGAFYDDPGFVEAFREVTAPILEAKKPDYVIFSFHGLPERQVKKTDRTKRHCLRSENCCDRIQESNKNCYRAQCFETARKLAHALKLNPSQYTVSFQSRLGRTPWIRPYTDFIYNDLPAIGVKKVVVVSPSFVADCLETLEEIAIRGREQFLNCGGEDLTLAPSLNDEASWVRALAELVKKNGKSAGV